MIALRILGLLWSLPVSLVGLVVVAFMAPSSPRLRGWVLEFTISRLPAGYGAITFGHVQAYRDAPERHRRHEDVHTLQGDILGILNFPVYGACSLISRLRGTGWYHGNALEAWARRASQ